MRRPTHARLSSPNPDFQEVKEIKVEIKEIRVEIKKIKVMKKQKIAKKT